MMIKVIFSIMCIVLAHSKIIRVGKHFFAYFTIVDSNARVLRNCTGNFTKTSQRDCLAKCMSNEGCQTFNYNSKEKICEILNVSKFDGVGYLERQRYWTHYETDCNQKKVIVTSIIRKYFSFHTCM